ncbi:MAG: family 43 glycosylhydrolase [Cytophagales bacterium]|nr:family 43 glycosylhydrolase [Cytophagales bacterium]
MSKTKPDMHSSLKMVLCAVLSVLLLAGCSTGNCDKVYMFSYFVGNGEDGLHLAYSFDGTSWKPLNDGKAIIPPLVGESCLMRDPCITSGPDGTFHMVWTTSWAGNTIGYAFSKDLVHWSEQMSIPVMAHEEHVMNCWAPEINYIPEDDHFMIYWSSTVADKFSETANSTRNGHKRNHRIYYTTTRDFRSFSETGLLYEPGFNVIDASIVPLGNKYAMFIKNETELPIAEKNISVVYADQITGPYDLPERPITGDYWAEGPTAIRINGKWHVYFDKYRKHEFGLLTSKNLTDWHDASARLKMPEGIRHGTVFEVDHRIYRQSAAAKIKLPMLYRDISRRGRPYAKDPSVVYFNEQYLMYYSIPPGDKENQNGWHIGVASSSNLKDWEKTGEILPEAPYEKKGLCAPEVVVIDNEIHLFYQTYGNREKDAICHAVSADGFNFKRNDTNPVFSPGGDWNIGRAIDAEVHIKKDTAYLFWATRDKKFEQQFLGVSKAPVSEGFSKASWQQVSSKPLLKPELSWEMNCIEAASVFEANDKYYMFYAGAYNHEGQQIGLAVSDDLTAWTRTSDQPVLPKGKANEWNSWESGHPGAFIDPAGEKWLFYQGNPDKGYTYYLSGLKFEIGEDDKITFEYD